MHGKTVSVEALEQHFKDHHCKKEATCPQCGFDQIHSMDEGLDHYKNCPDTVVQCKLCQTYHKNKDMEAHMEECSQRYTFCKECGESILIEDLKQHLDTVCPEVLVKCEVCDLLIPRKK